MSAILRRTCKRKAACAKPRYFNRESIDSFIAMQGLSRKVARVRRCRAGQNHRARAGGAQDGRADRAFSARIALIDRFVRGALIAAAKASAAMAVATD